MVRKDEMHFVDSLEARVQGLSYGYFSLMVAEKLGAAVFTEMFLLQMLELSWRTLTDLI